MASSLIGGLIANGTPKESIIVSDPLDEVRSNNADKYGVCVTDSNKDVASKSTVIVLAVKPNIVRQAVTEVRQTMQKKLPLLVSIAAGIRLGDIDEWSGRVLAIVRVMPNTPALIQKGISAMYANERVSGRQKQQAQAILEAVGKTVWLSDEKFLDAVTAVSGSGPAYVFYLIEAIEQAASELGLDTDTAHLLATETAVGAALLAAQSDESPSTLRHRVTSPGGTTQAAVKKLQSAAVKQSIVDAIHAAERRSVEMSKPADS